jgi:TubC N-terminal docking domain
MTAAVDLLRDLTRSGVRLERRGDRLHVEAPAGTLTADLRQVLTDRKAELLGVLTESDGTLSALRAHLFALAGAEGIDAALVRFLPDAGVAECAGLSDETLRAYVLALRDSALRLQGKVPADETAAIHCAHCGPVWAHPAVAAVLPIVDRWSRALGCPWCHIRKAGGAIPRPPVCCGDCANFTRDNVNPSGGIGHCAAGCKPLRPWPNVSHNCKSFARLRTV